MGNPLSPTIADLVIYSLLEEFFEFNYKTKFIAKCVDDIFAIVNREKIDHVLQLLNKFDEKINLP